MQIWISASPLVAEELTAVTLKLILCLACIGEFSEHLSKDFQSDPEGGE